MTVSSLGQRGLRNSIECTYYFLSVCPETVHFYFASSCLIFYNLCLFFVFFFNDTATPEIYPLPLHDALPISGGRHTARDEERVARQAHVAPPVVGGNAALVAPEPLDALPREVAARGERHHDAPPAPPARQRHRGAGACRAQVPGGQRRRRLERLRIARVDLERHRHGRAFIAHRHPRCSRGEALISSGPRWPRSSSSATSPTRSRRTICARCSRRPAPANRCRSSPTGSPDSHAASGSSPWRAPRTPSGPRSSSTVRN